MALHLLDMPAARCPHRNGCGWQQQLQRGWMAASIEEKPWMKLWTYLVNSDHRLGRTPKSVLKYGSSPRKISKHWVLREVSRSGKTHCLSSSSEPAKRRSFQALMEVALQADVTCHLVKGWHLKVPHERENLPWCLGPWLAIYRGWRPMTCVSTDDLIFTNIGQYCSIFTSLTIFCQFFIYNIYIYIYGSSPIWNHVKPIKPHAILPNHPRAPRHLRLQHYTQLPGVVCSAGLLFWSPERGDSAEGCCKQENNIGVDDWNWDIMCAHTYISYLVYRYDIYDICAHISNQGSYHHRRLVSLSYVYTCVYTW